MLLSEVNDEAAWFGLRREWLDPRVVARFTVPGEPMSKARARVVNGHAFTPERTKRAEEMVGWAFRSAAGSYVPRADEAYGVIALFFAATRQRRDVDNMLKLVLDGLNGVAWRDDAQVIEVSGRKSHVETKEEARTEVAVYVLGERQPTSACEWCGSSYRTYPSWEGKRRYCSAECRIAQQRQQALRLCATCGETFESKTRRKFCSTECQRHGGRAVRPCEQCGTDVERFTSWVKNGRTFCGAECRATYWRNHRAVAARGVCSFCGGHTSKKSYTRCRSCVIEGRQ